MISARLVRLIESNGDQIIDRVAAQIRREPEITHGKALLDYELRGLGHDLLRHLGDWLSSGTIYDLGLSYEHFGRLCYQQEIPLHEALHALGLLRDKMLDVAQENMMSNSSVELYAEEELGRRLGRFFDRLAVHLARGFEDAVRHPESAKWAIH